ncbi:MAG TPA: DUF4942 domain-containing protein [Gaiellaceae bacterium]
MNVIFNEGAVALSGGTKILDVVSEYDAKLAAIPAALAAFEAAGNALKMGATVGGTFGDVSIDTGDVSEDSLRRCLLRSAWKHVYEAMNIKLLASPRDKKRFAQSLADAPPFTLDNLRATFGDYVKNPRRSMLRAFAEVFCDLDPYYKSHEKMKVGVKGLPKRIILSNVGGYSSWGRERLEATLNALAVMQGKPTVTYREIEALLKREDALLADGEIPGGRYEEPVKVVGRGVRLRKHGNGNGHLFFEPETLKLINLALAEFYGEVLPDCEEEKPEQRRASTAVSRDLQYYPTPVDVAEKVVDKIEHGYSGRSLKGEKVLEPSCGCGRLMDALRKRGAKVIGVEVDPRRAREAEAKGHQVIRENFLEVEPTPTFDRVVMNPPFYGKHYAKHVEHALRFLRPGGILTAILPASARYDHGLLEGSWEDLPVGSFVESGTGINTTVLTIYNRED